MVVEVLEDLLDQLLDGARDSLFVILMMVLDLRALILKLFELHQASEGLVEVEYLLAGFVWQPVARRPDVLGVLAQELQENLDLSNAPYLLFLVLYSVV